MNDKTPTTVCAHVDISMDGKGSCGLSGKECPKERYEDSEKWYPCASQTFVEYMDAIKKGYNR